VEENELISQKKTQKEIREEDNLKR